MTPEGATERNLAIGARLLEVLEREGLWGLELHFDEFCHPDFEWRPAIAGLGGNVYRGRDGYGEWLADLDGIATEVMLGDFEIRPIGEDRLLALGRVHFVGRESGLPLDNELAAVFRVDDGRARSGHAFLSHAEARKAAAEELKVDADA